MNRSVLCCLLTLVGIQWCAADEPFRFTEKKDATAFVLTEGESPVFSYIYDVVAHENVPEKDRRRTAGCYVHPLYGLNGEILTDNAPRDHYHHHGVFWTWPHVGVHQPDGSVKRYDLWTSNTDLKQHFVGWKGTTTSPDFAAFAFENGWFVGDPKDGVKIMKENVEITVYRAKTVDGVKSRAIDFRFVWTPTDKPISLRGAEEKSYGGLSIRFKPYVEPNQKEAKPSAINVITVPGGPTDKDLPETPLAWADYTSKFGEGDQRSGATLFVPKTHPDYPPTWLTRYYGPLCIGWPGVSDKTFQPGEEIKLNYRLWIHDSSIDTKQIEKAYDEFCNPE